jgi:hypothetical protein
MCRVERVLQFDTETGVTTSDATLASVHVYDWGNALAARSCVQVGLGLGDFTARELMKAALPIALLCELPQAQAMAAFISELGGSVQVKTESSMGSRLLARLSPGFGGQV